MNIRNALLYRPRQAGWWKILPIRAAVGAIPYVGYLAVLALLLPIAAARRRGDHHVP